ERQDRPAFGRRGDRPRGRHRWGNPRWDRVAVDSATTSAQRRSVSQHDVYPLPGRRYRNAQMKRVIGIGGIFFKARDPEKLVTWYKEHLGFDVEDWGGVRFQEGAGDNLK